MKEGEIFYADKTRYQGQTKETKLRHGKGIMYDASGKITFEGTYRDNIPS